MKKSYFILKNFFYSTLLLVFILEFLFQIIFVFDVKILKKTILFFNPYCDQGYWTHEGKSTYDNSIFLTHPTLTLIKKKNKNFFESNFHKDSLKNNSDLVFYGSSFIDHKYFIPNFTDNVNYAIKSYGIDQIYQSYILTKNHHPDSNIVIGFLLEDIDRVLFNQRNFPKMKYEKINNEYKITNLPIKIDEIKNKKIFFYTYNLFKNLIFLNLNEYDYKKNKCKDDFKKNIFKFFINNIVDESKMLNQNLIFVIFSFEENIMNPNWRYLFLKEFFLHKNITHIDTVEIIKDDMKENNITINQYYSNSDFHLSKYGFETIIKKLNSLIGQYK